MSGSVPVSLPVVFGRPVPCRAVFGAWPVVPCLCALSALPAAVSRCGPALACPRALGLACAGCPLGAGASRGLAAPHPVPLPLVRSLRWACRCRLSSGRSVRSLSLFPSAAPAVVGFSGSRRLAPAFAPLVFGVVGAVLAAGRSVAVGCAAGADAFVRSTAPGALVFSAAAFGSGRGAFAARSVALVRAVAAGGPGSGFVVFPGAPCPAGLSPSARSSACFCGFGSGSWASAAFAAGLGLPLVVFPCGFSALPSWGSWVPAGSGVWAVGFRLVR